MRRDLDEDHDSDMRIACAAGSARLRDGLVAEGLIPPEEPVLAAENARLRRRAADLQAIIHRVTEGGAQEIARLRRQLRRLVAIHAANVIRERGRSYLLATAARRIARKHGVAPVDVKGPSRRIHIVRARQELCWVGLMRLQRSASEIGRFLGRNHATVMHSARRHQARIDRGEAEAL
jgi:chromosomal replication initiation ATPase DnaA